MFALRPNDTTGNVKIIIGSEPDAVRLPQDFLQNECVCVSVGGGEGDGEESGSGYFQLCPFSYLMVFIGAKGQRCCVLCAFPNVAGRNLAPCWLVWAVSLKMHGFPPRGAVTPTALTY